MSCVPSIIALIFITFSAFLLISHQYFEAEIHLSTSLVHYSHYLFQILSTVQFVFALAALRARLKLINEYLRDNFINNQFLVVVNTSNFEKTLIDFADYYNKLCDGIDLVNSSFSFPVILKLTLEWFKLQNSNQILLYFRLCHIPATL